MFWLGPLSPGVRANDIHRRCEEAGLGKVRGGAGRGTFGNTSTPLSLSGGGYPSIARAARQVTPRHSVVLVPCPCPSPCRTVRRRPPQVRITFLAAPANSCLVELQGGEEAAARARAGALVATELSQEVCGQPGEVKTGYREGGSLILQDYFARVAG